MDDRSGSGSVAATLRGMSGLSVPSVHDDGADVPASWQAIDEMVPVRADADRPSAALAQALAKGRAEQAEQEATLERLRAEMSSLERLIDRSGGVTDEVVQLEQSVAHLQDSGGLGDNHALVDALNRLGSLSRAERVLTAYAKVTEQLARAQRALEAEGEREMEPVLRAMHDLAQAVEEAAEVAPRLVRAARDRLVALRKDAEDRVRQSLREALSEFGWPRVPGKDAVHTDPGSAATAALERRIEAAVHAQVDLARIKGTDLSTAFARARRDSLAVLELWRPLHLRLVYHFASGADTAQADRPEWLLSFVLNCLRLNMPLLSRHVAGAFERAFVDIRALHGVEDAGEGEDPVEHRFLAAAVGWTADRLEKSAVALAEEGQREALARAFEEAVVFDAAVRQSYGYGVDPRERQRTVLNKLAGPQPLFRRLCEHETRAVRGITEACTEPLAPALSMVRGVDGVDGASRQDALTATSEVVAGMDILGRLGDRLRALSNRDRRLALATQVVGALVRAFVEGLVPHVSSWRGRPLDWDPWCRAVNGVDVVLDAMRELADDPLYAGLEAHKRHMMSRPQEGRVARLARSASESLTTLGASTAAAAAGKVLAKTPLSSDAGGIGPRDAMQAFASVMSSLAKSLPGRGDTASGAERSSGTTPDPQRHEHEAGGSGAAAVVEEEEEEWEEGASGALAHQTCGFFSPFAAFLEQYTQAWVEDAVASVQDRVLGPMAVLEAFISGGPARGAVAVHEPEVSDAACGVVDALRDTLGSLAARAAPRPLASVASKVASWVFRRLGANVEAAWPVMCGSHAQQVARDVALLRDAMAVYAPEAAEAAASRVEELCRLARMPSSEAAALATRLGEAVMGLRDVDGGEKGERALWPVLEDYGLVALEGWTVARLLDQHGA